MSVTFALSVTGLTIKATIVAGLAIVALLLSGWRKPARAEPRSPRGERSSGRQSVAVPVDHFDTPEYRRPGPIRRVLALIASGGLAVLIGVVAAIVMAFGIAVAIIRLTNLLQQ